MNPLRSLPKRDLSARLSNALRHERAFWRNLRGHVFGWSSGEQALLFLLTAVIVVVRAVVLLARCFDV